MLAAALGHATLSAQITHVSDAVLLILGTGLISATTTLHLPPTPDGGLDEWRQLRCSGGAS